MLCIYQDKTPQAEHRYACFTNTTSGPARQTQHQLSHIIQDLAPTHPEIRCLLDDSQFAFFFAPQTQILTEPLTQADLQLRAEQVLYDAQGKFSGYELLYCYLADQQVNTQKVTSIYGTTGQVSCTLIGVLVRRLAIDKLTKYRKQLHIMPQALPLISYLHDYVAKRPCVILQIGDTMSKLLLLTAGTTIESDALPLGKKQLTQLLLEHHMQPDDTPPSSFKIKMLEDIYSFFCKQLVSRIAQYLTTHRDILVVADSMCYDDIFFRVFQECYQAHHQGYVVPFHYPSNVSLAKKYAALYARGHHNDRKERMIYP